jgi:dienelactone hydrolase
MTARKPINRLMIIVPALLIGLFILWKPIHINVKAVLLLSQQFPQIPVKPLHLVTRSPTTEYVELGTHQDIIADVFAPRQPGPHPALILAMGVRTLEKDRPAILGLADSLARLGYVTMWPRSKAMEEQRIKFEDPQAFVESFRYLRDKPQVLKDRISFVGFSVGSSIATIAAAERSIADQVHALFCFGGYYSLVDYLTALATLQITVDGQTVDWQPADYIVETAHDVLAAEGLSLDIFKTDAIPDDVSERLKRISPDAHLQNLKSRTFILHDVGDTAVPWTESRKLKRALEGKLPISYHISAVFEHVQPKRGFDLAMAVELLKLYRFFYLTLDFI